MGTTYLLLLLLLIPLSLSLITGVTYSLTSYSTIQPAVTYTFNLTLNGDSISANSAISIQFSNTYIINSLTACTGKLTTVGASTSLTCSVAAIATGYNATFLGLFPIASNPTFMQIQVLACLRSL